MKPAFRADRTLGKLVKWLRLMGFDTIIESGSLGPDFERADKTDRLVLTRTEEIWRKIPKKNAIWIQANDPRSQIRQLISQLGIEYAALKPFTRCLDCNATLKPISRHETFGVVPDYIYETQPRFNQCPDCHRIFWSGSHVSRSRERLETIFSD